MVQTQTLFYSIKYTAVLISACPSTRAFFQKSCQSKMQKDFLQKRHQKSKRKSVILEEKNTVSLIEVVCSCGFDIFVDYKETPERETRLPLLKEEKSKHT